MKNKFELKCYKKGRFVGQDPTRTTRSIIYDDLVISIWQNTKNRFFFCIENIVEGESCSLRIKTLMEAIVLLQEIYTILKEPKFAKWQTEYKTLYENAKPLCLKNLIESKNCKRLATPRGLVNYKRFKSIPVALMLNNIGYPYEIEEDLWS